MTDPTDFTEQDCLKIMEQCPRFDFCSAPKCPLDLWEDRRTELPGEDKCGLGKTYRLRIGKDTPLPRQGYTKREWAGVQQMKNISPERKAQLAAQGRKALAGLHNKRRKAANRRGSDD